MNQLPFFVYGTLLPGQPNYVLWQHAIQHLEPAGLAGSALFDLDWYPMVVDWPGSRVEGLLVSVEAQAYPAVLSRLDFLEGYDQAEPAASDYRRERRVVTLSGGRPVVAWVYLGRRALVAGRPRIQANWIAHLRHERRPVADWWQTVPTIGRA